MLGFAEGMIVGAANSKAAALRGDARKVFDWDKAARLIRERQPTEASAGLATDWDYTGGRIWSDGKPDTDSYTYLASLWATPELDMDGEVVDCFTTENPQDWDADTKWPDSALAILAA